MEASNTARKRIGIYGGSFNPIHDGHTSLGKMLLDAGLVDEVWLVVSPQNPLKADFHLLDDQARLRLAQLAVEDTDPRLRVSDIEMRLPRPSYMWHTLSTLCDEHPLAQFVLVIGADNWVNFHLWHRHQDLINQFPILIYPRPGYPVDREQLPPSVTLLDTPLLDISSTAIRKQIAEGTFAGEGVSPRVWEEIRRMGWYTN